MGATCVEELQIWQRARALCDAVSAITALPPLSQDFNLRDQLDAATESILSNIAEGFGQGTDRAFARHLFIARGSSNEARAQLIVAHARRHITQEQLSALERETMEIGWMISALIRYLLRSNRKDRC